MSIEDTKAADTSVDAHPISAWPIAVGEAIYPHASRFLVRSITGAETNLLTLLVGRVAVVLEFSCIT